MPPEKKVSLEFTREVVLPEQGVIFYWPTLNGPLIVQQEQRPIALAFKKWDPQEVFGDYSSWAYLIWTENFFRTHSPITAQFRDWNRLKAYVIRSVESNSFVPILDEEFELTPDHNVVPPRPRCEEMVHHLKTNTYNYPSIKAEVVPWRLWDEDEPEDQIVWRIRTRDNYTAGVFFSWEEARTCLEDLLTGTLPEPIKPVSFEGVLEDRRSQVKEYLADIRQGEVAAKKKWGID